MRVSEVNLPAKDIGELRSHYANYIRWTMAFFQGPPMFKLSDAPIANV